MVAQEPKGGEFDPTSTYVGPAEVNMSDVGVALALDTEIELIEIQLAAGAELGDLAALGYETDIAVLSGASMQPEGRPAASGVSITPKDPVDQRTEIAISSDRNSHLMAVDEHLSGYNGRDTLLRRIEEGVQTGFAAGQIRKLRSNRDTHKRQAEANLHAACSTCMLPCQIRDKFPKWARVHGSAQGKKQTADQEPRDKWRRRLLDDPDAQCLPPREAKK